ncbi:uncharacterized protein [Watersipora subatra]|uniref:uncharacterized protein n=1 Tax=Watersipora subatra TaxID=2589382 RepID=UPI00355B45D9
MTKCATSSSLSRQNLIRMANKIREKNRPKHPKSKDFEVSQPRKVGNLNIFLVIQLHLIFSTDTQLDTLKKSRTLYLDGTFKCVKRPFEQLLMIYAFIRQGCFSKQVLKDIK